MLLFEAAERKVNTEGHPRPHHVASGVSADVMSVTSVTSAGDYTVATRMREPDFLTLYAQPGNTVATPYPLSGPTVNSGHLSLPSTIANPLFPSAPAVSTSQPFSLPRHNFYS